MKTIFNLGNGLLVLTEQGGIFTLTLTGKATLGGGAVAGVVSAQGAGSIVISGKQAFDLGMSILEAHSPAALVAIEQAGQAMADVAITNQ